MTLTPRYRFILLNNHGDCSECHEMSQKCQGGFSSTRQQEFGLGLHWTYRLLWVVLWFECEKSSIGSCVWTLSPLLVVLFGGLGTFMRWHLTEGSELLGWALRWYSPTQFPILPVLPEYYQCVVASQPPLWPLYFLCHDGMSPFKLGAKQTHPSWNCLLTGI